MPPPPGSQNVSSGISAGKVIFLHITCWLLPNKEAPQTRFFEASYFSLKLHIFFLAGGSDHPNLTSLQTGYQSPQCLDCRTVWGGALACMHLPFHQCQQQHIWHFLCSGPFLISMLVVWVMSHLHPPLTRTAPPPFGEAKRLLKILIPGSLIILQSLTVADQFPPLSA